MIGSDYDFLLPGMEIAEYETYFFINIQWCIQYWISIFRHLVWDIVHSFQNKQKQLQRTMSCFYFLPFAGF